METDLLVTTVSPEGVAGALQDAFPESRLHPGCEVSIAPRQSVRAHRDEADPRETNVNIYDRGEAGGLADRVFEILITAFPADAVLQYGSDDEVIRSNHPEIVTA